MAKHQHRTGIVYSTNPDFEFSAADISPDHTLPPAKQVLKIALDKKARAGKRVTIVSGYSGKTTDLETLSKTIKTKCSVGGSVKDREIVIQGDLRDKIKLLLEQLGYICKVV